MKPEDLLAVMTSESGLNPSAYEEKYKGSGLIGFMPDTLKGLGYKGTWEDFIKLSGEEQLDWVKKFIQGKSGLMGGRKFTSAGLYYTGNLWPIALKLPGVIKGDPNTRILESNPERDPSGKYSKKYFDLGYKINADFESKAYKANPLFDRVPGDTTGKQKKGYITYGDMIRQTEINKKNPAYQNAVATMARQTGYQPGKVQTSMVAQNDNTLQGLDSIMDKYLQQIQQQKAATTYDLKKIYKKSFPTHDILIQISAPDYSSAIEFSNVLSSALDEDLLSNVISIYGWARC
ncbi:MAG: SIKE family protein [Thioploca sp.]|nr:SIKE family protein [Thioploca sp.]